MFELAGAASSCLVQPSSLQFGHSYSPAAALPRLQRLSSSSLQQQTSHPAAFRDVTKPAGGEGRKGKKTYLNRQFNNLLLEICL